MLDVSVLPLFVGVILLFLAPPGPDMTYMLAVGLDGGRSAALKAILGIGTGMLAYATAVALGLGAVAHAYPTVLTLVRAGGAIYLVWLAVTTVRHARDPAEDVHLTTARRWYLRGLVVSLTNPKVMLFYLAVLPRFIGRAQNIPAQLVMLGVVNTATEVILYGGLGVVASTFRRHLAARPGSQVALAYLAATVYMVLAIVIGVEAARSLHGA